MSTIQRRRKRDVSRRVITDSAGIVLPTRVCVCVFLKSYVKDRDNIRAGVSLTLLLLFSGGLTSGVSGGFY